MKRGKKTGKALYLIGLALATCRWGRAQGISSPACGAASSKAAKSRPAPAPETPDSRSSPTMNDTPEKTEIQRGLKGVYFDRSRVCYIDGRAGELRYRGYSIHDLAERSTCEETCCLLLKGELPTRSQLETFTNELKAARSLPEGVYEIIRTVKHAHPMAVLRTGVSALSAFDPETADKSPEATLRKGIRLTAQVPMIVATTEHLR